MHSQRTEPIRYAELLEDDLVSRIRQGDGRAFRELTQRYNRRLFRVARGVVRDDAEAEDIVQEAYLRAYARLAGFRGECRFSTWLTRIVLNAAIGRIRRRRSAESFERALRTGDRQVIEFPRAHNDDPEAALARAEMRRLLERAIDELPDPFRLVFMMRDVEDMSAEETAESLGIRPETVKTRLHRARRRLRRSLADTMSTALEDAFPFAGVRCARMTAAVFASLQTGELATSTQAGVPEP
jgi:RNA polymerase sigma-70 factor (ECF subfamily)